MAVRLSVAKNEQTMLVGNITNLQATVTVAGVSLFPTAPFIIVGAENVEVSAFNAGSKQVTVEQSKKGTTATTYNNGAKNIRAVGGD